MLNKVSIHITLLGTQLHMSAIEKLSRYNSDLFYVHSMSSVATLPNTDLCDWAYSKDAISSWFAPERHADITVGIIENKIEDNYFARRLGDKSGVVTFYQAEAILRDANIDVFNYLLLTIYKLVTLYRLSDGSINEDTSQFIHDETRGCIFDMVGNKYDLVHSAANAHLCSECEAHLSQRKLPSNFVVMLKSELKKIRKSRYNKLMEFIKSKPILSIIITVLSTIILDIFASFLFELLFK